MKTRIIIFLALSAVVTLSFTFASVTRKEKTKAEPNSVTTKDEPIGGFLAEDKL